MNYPIVNIKTSNYKNLLLKDVPLSSLNIFIGPNGSGKSNFVALLRFLQQSIIDSAFDLERGRTSFEDAVYELGAEKILDGTLSKPANVEIEYTFEDHIVLHLGLLVQSQRRQVIVDDERLSQVQKQSQEGPFYFYQAHNRRSGEGVVSIYEDLTQGKQTHYEKLSAVPVNDLVLTNISKLLENSEFSPEQTPIYDMRRRLIESIRRWRFYNANNMNLGEIRAAEPKLGPTDEYLSSSGENLALVFHNLVQFNFEFEEQINQLLKDILPTSRKIRAVTSGRLGLTIEWYVDGIAEPFYLDEMSDGTVRMLCWAIVLNSPKLPSLLVIDEPELGIHVAWLPKLAEWIKTASLNTQVIISTHSPDLLDYFTDQLETENKLYAFQAESLGRTHFSMNRLTSERIQEFLAEGWQLGDLYRVGNPGVGGWPW